MGMQRIFFTRGSNFFLILLPSQVNSLPPQHFSILSGAVRKLPGEAFIIRPRVVKTYMTDQTENLEKRRISIKKNNFLLSWRPQKGWDSKGAHHKVVYHSKYHFFLAPSLRVLA